MFDLSMGISRVLDDARRGDQMFRMEWWLSVGSESGPDEIVPKLRRRVSNLRRSLAALMVVLGIGLFSIAMMRDRPMALSDFNLQLAWGSVIMLALLAPTIVQHPTWSARKRRTMLIGFWIASVMMVLACAYDMGMYSAARWGQARAWDSFFVGMGMGAVLLGLLGWFMLAGIYLRRHGRCACPPALKRWMKTAPVARSAFDPHACPKPAASEAMAA